MIWDPETQTYRKVLSYAEMRKQLRSQPDKKLSLDKLNELIGTQTDFWPNKDRKFEAGQDIIYDKQCEDKAYFYRTLGMKLGYAREYTGHKEVDFIDYNQKRRLERAENRRSTFFERDKENLLKNTNSQLKVSGSSSKMLNQNPELFKARNSRPTVGSNDKHSNSFVSDRSYTPSLNPPNCSFEDIEKRFKERRLYRL